jgi:hypothetical protein
MPAELSTTQISETVQPTTFSQHANVTERGGSIAKEAREKLELETGKPAISPLNAKSDMMSRKTPDSIE